MIACPRCDAECRPGQHFCIECGSPLAGPCPACGAETVPGAKFCGECGVLLGAQPHGAVSERRASYPATTEHRLVSVLFADLVGFTGLAESLDPEHVQEIQTRYFQLAEERVRRFGGTVEKFIGDAVMAVWGTPVAHEDDAERAVRAALEFTESVAELELTGVPRLTVRSAVMTGDAAVTLGAAGQGMVSGDIVNTAARLQQVAPPGTVLVGEATYRQAKAAIAFEATGEHALAGKSTPVSAWRALRVIAARGGARRDEGTEAPFVGRVRELRLLKDILETTSEQARPALVSVIGQPGIGKSRLAWEVEKYADGLAHPVFWHRGRSPSYGEAIAHWPLVEMVRVRAAIREGDGLEESREKLDACLREWVLDADERSWLARRLGALLGLGPAPPGEQQELHAAWRLFFERVSEHAPVVLVFEDLQWADGATIGFIEHLLQWAARHPILVITLARRDLLTRRPDWGARQPNFVSIALDPLSDGEMRQVLEGLVPGLPDDAVARILARAEGVPLYAVEIVNRLLAQGYLAREGSLYRLRGDLEQVPIPETLRALIAARLDSLDEGDRALLHAAAVLGQSFTVESLATLSGEREEVVRARLDRTVKAELLRVEADPHVPGGGRFSFSQTLVAEEAYARLSRSERRARHLASARYYQALDRDDLSGIVANHYLVAYRATPPSEEAATLAVHARDAMRAAAAHAAGLHAHEEALGYLEQALAVTDDPELRAEMWQAAAHSARATLRYADAERYLRQAMDWHGEQGNRGPLAHAMAELARLLELEPAIETLEQALDEVAGMEDDPAAVELVAALAAARLYSQDYPQALQLAEQAITGADGMGLRPLLVDALITKGTALTNLGRVPEGVALLSGALSLAQRSDLVASELRARLDISAGGLLLSEPTAAMQTARDGMALARRLGLRDWAVALASPALSVAFLAGEWEWALETIAELHELGLPAEWQTDPGVVSSVVAAFRGDVSAYERLATVGSRREGTLSSAGQAYLRFNRALAGLATGRLEQAYEDAIAATKAGAAAVYAAVGPAYAARAALWLERIDDARAALESLEALPLPGAVLDAYRSTLRGGLAASAGDRNAAHGAYAEAARLWRDLGLEVELALCQLERATFAAGDEEEVRLAAGEAHRILKRLGAEALLQRLPEALTAEPVAGIAPPA